MLISLPLLLFHLLIYARTTNLVIPNLEQFPQPRCLSFPIHHPNPNRHIYSTTVITTLNLNMRILESSFRKKVLTVHLFLWHPPPEKLLLWHHSNAWRISSLVAGSSSKTKIQERTTSTSVTVTQSTDFSSVLCAVWDQSINIPRGWGRTSATQPVVVGALHALFWEPPPRRF